MKELKDLTEYDRKNLKSNCGIYFLLKDDVVVYIGQSVNLNTRPLNHPKKEHNKILIYFCTEKKLNRMEGVGYKKVQSKIQ